MSSTVAWLKPFVAKTLRAASRIPAVRNSVTTSFFVLMMAVVINLHGMTVQSVYYADGTKGNPTGLMWLLREVPPRHATWKLIVREACYGSGKDKVFAETLQPVTVPQLGRLDGCVSKRRISSVTSRRVEDRLIATGMVVSVRGSIWMP